MGVSTGDFDQDGDTDIISVCDGAPNLFFENVGDGNFEEAAVLRGLAFDLRGRANGNMGIDVADVDGDLLEDLFVTTYTGQLPTLFINSPGGFFADQTRRSRIGTEVIPHVNWSAGLVDLNNDGLRDAFICNGHFLKKNAELTGSTSFAVRNIVMQNQPDNRFVPVSLDLGGDARSSSSRGAVFDDLDNDGDIDVAILNCDAPAQLLENQNPSQQNWLELELIARSGNRNGLGAKVTLQSDSGQQFAERRAGRGYQSDCGGRLHFGLGNDAAATRLTIVWPGGASQSLENVAANQILTVIQPLEQRSEE